MRKQLHSSRVPNRWSVQILGLAGLGLLIVGVNQLAVSRPVAHSLNFYDKFASGNLEPGVPRRPLQFALIKGVNVGSFDFQARLRREGRSMMVVFNYIDTLHFYYTHLSMDTGATQPVHNGIFIVNGEPRKRVAGIDAAAALPNKNWHQVRVTRHARDGSIKVFMDGSDQPLFSLVDSTFTCGQVGIGSFDETGDFEDVSLKSADAGCQPHAPASPAKAASLR